VPDARGELDIRLSGPGQLAGQLSGGNQQKLSLAKWLAADCDILVIDEPTVGIDVRTNPSPTGSWSCATTGSPANSATIRLRNHQQGRRTAPARTAAGLDVR
jgi:hypothetical protein